MRHLFADRREAGRVLANRLRHYSCRTDAMVLGLPRGGVVVAYEVAAQLNLPLDAFIVRKLGVPGHEELALGAIASGGVRILNNDILQTSRVTVEQLEAITHEEHQELARRERAYRAGDPFPHVTDKTVILVDDGLATGASMRAAVAALRQAGPARTVVAVPVAAPEVCKRLTREVEEVVCAVVPERFTGVGRWYGDFSQTTDEEVRELLRLARASRPQTLEEPS